MTDDEAADRLARFFFRLAKWLISGVFVVVFLFLRYLFTHHPKIFWALLGVVGVVAVFYFGIYTLSQTNSVPVQTHYGKSRTLTIRDDLSPISDPLL